MRAVFLDRDGVINRQRHDHVKNQDEFELLPGVSEALGNLRELGFRLVIVTNQSAVNRGLLSWSKLENIHTKMLELLKSDGVIVDAIYVCPHTPDERCECRKPGTLLFERAVRELGLDVSQCWLIGDKDSDIKAGEKIGCKTIRVETDGSLSNVVGIISKYLNEAEKVERRNEALS